VLEEDFTDFGGEFGGVVGGEGGGGGLDGEEKVGEEVVTVEITDRFLLVGKRSQL
jgi:hypothetical protein